MSDTPTTPPSEMTDQPEPAMDANPHPEQAPPQEDPLSVAQAEVAKLTAVNAELADQFLRAKAEAENARRRADEEVSKARKFAVESFAESLLPVADSLTAGCHCRRQRPAVAGGLRSHAAPA